MPALRPPHLESESHPPSTAALPSPSRGPYALWLACGVGAMALVLIAAPMVPTRFPLPATVLATALLTAATFWSLYALVPLPLRASDELVGLGVAGAGWWLLSGIKGAGLGALTLNAAASVCFFVACGLLGRLLARMVRDRNLLLPVLLTAAAADVFTVSVGPAHQALHKAPHIVRSLSLALPRAGSAAGKQGLAGLTVAASIGLGDFVFSALFLAAAWRHGLDVKRAAGWAASLALLAMTAVLLVPPLPALPLLPFIALGVLLPNYHRFVLSREEWLALAVGGVFLIGLLVAMYVGVR
jgi:hypothetical protein